MRGGGQRDRVVKVLIVDMAKFWMETANFDFGHGGKVAKFCFSSDENLWRNLVVKFSCFVLRIFEPPRILPPTLSKFHRALGRNFLVRHIPVRETFREGASPENSTAKLR